MDSALYGLAGYFFGSMSPSNLPPQYLYLFLFGGLFACVLIITPRLGGGV